MGSLEQRFKVIGILVEIEESAKELYTVFVERLPEHKDFWQEMAKEEQNHVGLVHTLGASVASDEAKYNPDKFDPEDIKAILEWMKEQINIAKTKKDITFKEALAVSLAVEEKVSEKTYFEAFEGATEGVKEFLEGVRSSQDNHRDKVKELYDKEG